MMMIIIIIKIRPVTENWRKWQYKDLHYLQSSSDINGVINKKL
jgi:hypothetical protein